MDLQIKENIALAPLTTLKVGGAARFFVEAKTEADVSEALLFAEEKNLPLFVLGGGSNVLIADSGFDGLVLKISLKGIQANRENKQVIVTAKGGEDWDDFVKFCVEENLQGFECLSGIPGTVGGTPVQNVGAYGQEVSETIIAVKVLEVATGKIYEMTNSQCEFAYRTSIFNTTRKNQFIVLEVKFQLIPHGKPKIIYKDLREIFGEHSPTLEEARQAVLKIRRAKSMVLEVNDPNSKSAGSFFKNPIVTREMFRKVEVKAQSLEIETVPKYDVDENRVKIPAAWLIEKSGFHKGCKFGKAGLSSNHTLALINLDDAEARDILNLKQTIQESVKEKFGVELMPEPVFVGF